MAAHSCVYQTNNSFDYYLLTIRGRSTPSKAYCAIKELKAFKDYFAQQLAAELRDAMTIFDSNEMKGWTYEY